MGSFDQSYQLQDRYDLDKKRVFLTGIQALVRLPMMQHALDQRNGLNTAGFISGYRGSPLGAYDLELLRSKKVLEANDIHFEPGVNEDLGATAVWGTQLIDYYRDQANRDGVFSIWYGKGHGVDRSADVFRQANIQGTSKYGGVLALAGDDHTAESSMFAHQTDQIFEAAMMPVLFPSTVEEYLSMGLAGIALSRYCGLYVSFKAITETVESGASIVVPELPNFVMPEDFDFPPHGLNYDCNFNWPSERYEYERRMIEERAPAAHAFVYANKIDREVIRAPTRRFGIVTLGKDHGDMRDAFNTLGLTEQNLKDAGISVFKVGMSWPLDPRGIREFADGMESLFVIEEKRPQLEKQIKEQLYNWPVNKRPSIYGKRDERNEVLLPEVFDLNPELVARAMARWLKDTEIGAHIEKHLYRFDVPKHQRPANSPVRAPYFCSGCPHNTSTKVPDGSVSGAGIGCHIMVLGQGRSTETFTQMGGEGVQWVGLHRFSNTPHMFQNLGDGTYQHSGILAIRQAVVSNVNLTYKILYNDAVAMTGGQEAEGHPSPGQIAQQVLAEGVKRVALVSDDIEKFNNDSSVPAGVTRHDRSELDAVQCELREVEGVTVIIYEQTCAAEKRRRRKKGILEDPARRLFINDRVCEGCGDCSVQSNCISIEPLETDYGRKRKINQTTCNKDYSCVNGFCPSFVSVEGGELRKPDASHAKQLEDKFLSKLTDISVPALTEKYSILVAGIGGTGVLTIGGILSMAGHLQGLGATTLDFTGLSQKNGAVVAHIKIAPKPFDIRTARIRDGNANLLLACDMVAASQHTVKLRPGLTKSIINTVEVPTAQFTKDNDMVFPAGQIFDEFVSATKAEDVEHVDATRIAECLFGDGIATNLFMVGFAYQRGLIPLTSEAILRAIELNGVAVEFNQRAFLWGRFTAADADSVARLIAERENPASSNVVKLETLQQQEQHRYQELVAYQDAAYADRYRDAIAKVKTAEMNAFNKQGAISAAAIKYLYKLMAYKDEYEVARLYSNREFADQLKQQFAGELTLKFHLAPPLLSRKDRHTGIPKKITFGAWMLPVFKQLAKLKGLRGTALDVFGYTQERKDERQLIEDYLRLLDEVCANVNPDNQELAVQLLSLPEKIRGYGHVKDASIEKARVNWQTLRDEFFSIDAKRVNQRN